MHLPSGMKLDLENSITLLGKWETDLYAGHPVTISVRKPSKMEEDGA
jgi:hypothetical protein